MSPKKIIICTYAVLDDYAKYKEDTITKEGFQLSLTNDSENPSFLYVAFQKAIKMKLNIIKNKFSKDKMSENRLKESIEAYVRFNLNKYKCEPELSPDDATKFENSFNFKHHFIFSFAEWLHSISPCFIVPTYGSRYAMQLEPYWCGYSGEDPSIDGIHDRKMTIDRLDDDGKPIEKNIITKHIPSIFI